MKSDLIQCGDHKWAPWSIVCIHLIDGHCREWVALESSSDETDHDWVCPDCADAMAECEPSKEIVANLRPVCIHCVRQLRRQLDPVFQED